MISSYYKTVKDSGYLMCMIPNVLTQPQREAYALNLRELFISVNADGHEVYDSLPFKYIYDYIFAYVNPVQKANDSTLELLRQTFKDEELHAILKKVCGSI